MKKIHRGWVMVACGLVVLMMTAGMIVNTFGMYIIPISEELGCTRAQVSLIQTLFSIPQILIAAISGWLYQKIKLSRIMKIASVGVGLCYFLMSTAKSLPVLYILSILMASFSYLLTWMPFSVIITNWFTKNSGLALGITFTGSGIGGMAFYPILSALLQAYGWRIAMRILSAACIAVIVPIVYCVLKISPYDVGLAPYGAEEKQNAVHGKPELTGKGFAAICRTGGFIAILLSMVLVGLATNAVSANLTPHLQTLGYSVSTAATLSSMSMGALALGKILMGQVTDRLGITKALAIVGIAMTVGLVLLCFADSLPIAIAAVALDGVYQPISTVAFALIARSVYGTRDFSLITGSFTATNAIGCAIAPVALGMVFDMTGSYIVGYAVCAGLAAISMSIMYIAAKRAS